MQSTAIKVLPWCIWLSLRLELPLSSLIAGETIKVFKHPSLLANPNTDYHKDLHGISQVNNTKKLLASNEEMYFMSDVLTFIINQNMEQETEM